MEQPNIDISETDQVSEPITNCNKESSNADIDKGSTLGKFKDATSLLEAYNNLQKEFTRKSQKLASLTKEMNLGFVLNRDIEEDQPSKFISFFFNFTIVFSS